MSVLASGTQAAVIGTEHTLRTITTTTAGGSDAPGDYIFNVDAAAMLTNDVLQLRFYKQVLAGSTQRVYVMQSFSDAQSTDDQIATSIPVRIEYGGKVTLLQTAGTGRSYPWSVEKVD